MSAVPSCLYSAPLQALHGSRLYRQVASQGRIIGALLMREIHTRFGRENLGYLWLFLEPALLAAGVTALHLFQAFRLPHEVLPVPFYATGYGAFLAFRSIILRGCSAIESNYSLMFHRNVTLVDIFVARALLDVASVLAVMLLLLGGSYMLDLGHLPDRPLEFVSGWLLILWFSLSLSMLIGAATHAWPVVERLVHPLVYLMLPLSGVFVTFSMIPPQFRAYVTWVPTAHIIELVHQGVFRSLSSPDLDIPYVIAVCLVCSLLGLAALRAVRPRMVMT